MRGRVVAVLVAIVLAAVGGVMLSAYVTRADSRAMAGMEPTTVLVVLEPIAEGTPAEALGELVAAEKLPAVAVAPTAVSDLESLAGLVATTDLAPGEQVLAGRFAAPETLTQVGEVPVPDGLQSLSLLLAPERVVGGRVGAGDKVGIYVSLTDPKRTHSILHKVLVVRVQGGYVPAAEGAEVAEGAEEAPIVAESVHANDVMVTLAVSSADAEEIVFGLEHGSVWLTVEPDNAKTDGTRVVTDAPVEPAQSVFE